MNQIRSILEDTYQLAASSDSTYSALSKSQERWVNTLMEKAESFRAVLTVLITSLAKKIQTPTQDVRYHQDNLPNGYSGRGLDTEHITPFMKAKFRRFAMAESGWLPRSLEQPYPYTLEYPGKIRSKTVKDAFLQILNDVEENRADPKKYLQAIFSALIALMKESQINFDFLKEAEYTETVSRNQRTAFAVLGNSAKSIILNQSAIGVSFSMKSLKSEHWKYLNDRSNALF